MPVQADKGNKFDQGKINRILALITDMNDGELGITINRLRQEQVKRNQANGDLYLDTIQL